MTSSRTRSADGKKSSSFISFIQRCCTMTAARAQASRT